MGVYDIMTAFNERRPEGQPACHHVTMQYLDGGAREAFTFQIGERAIQVIVPAGSSKAFLISIATKAAQP